MPRDPRGDDPICVVARPEDLTEGLFGGVLIYLFQVLPYLRERAIYPTWSIASRLYGDEPDYLIVPGVLETAYPAPAKRGREVSLLKLGKRFDHVLGSDWDALAALWSCYFRIPDRINAMADQAGDVSNTLGVHYRGNDKNRNGWDSNPVTFGDFTTIIRDRLDRDSNVTRLFVATDEQAFIDYLRARIDLEIATFGAGKFHRTLDVQARRSTAADAAMADCVVLSRCSAVLNTSSALSAFAKVLNPALDIERCAASKLFTDIPYFPIAYIPIYRSENPEVLDILARTLRNDWSTEPTSRGSHDNFESRARRPLRNWVWTRLERLHRVKQLGGR